MLVRVVYDHDLSDRRGLFPRYYPSCRISSRLFTDLLRIHGYHPTLYTAEAASNQCPEIIAEKNGKLKLY